MSNKALRRFKETGKVFRDGKLVDPPAKRHEETPAEAAQRNEAAWRLVKYLARLRPPF